MTDLDSIYLHHGARTFWNSMPLYAPRITIFDVIHPHNCWRNFWKAIPLDAPWMTNFDDIHLWKFWYLWKFWNSLPLDMPGMTTLNIINFHHGWRKLWNSMPLDAPWMTKFWWYSNKTFELYLTSQTKTFQSFTIDVHRLPGENAQRAIHHGFWQFFDDYWRIQSKLWYCLTILDHFLTSSDEFP